MKVVSLVWAEPGEAGNYGASPSVATQRAAITALCARRGWELVDDVESPDPSQALASVRTGRADVLAVAKYTRVAGSVYELRRLAAEQWHLVAIDIGLDTTTPGADTVLSFIDRLAELEEEVPPAFRPPSELLFRVSGMDDARWVELTGARSVAELEAGLTAAGRRLDEFSRILDFGCGCGRVLWSLRRRLPSVTLLGSDIDEAAVEWVAGNIESVDARVNARLPPLPFEDDVTVDLAIAWSVFTHLDEDYQDAWLAELTDVLAPGGILLATIHGPFAWRWHRDGILAGPERATERRRLGWRLRTRGFAFWANDGWGPFFPDFFHTAFHNHGFIRRRWGRWFDVLAVLEGGAGSTQDLVVARRK